MRHQRRRRQRRVHQDHPPAVADQRGRGVGRADRVALTPQRCCGTSVPMLTTQYSTVIGGLSAGQHSAAAGGMQSAQTPRLPSASCGPLAARRRSAPGSNRSAAWNRTDSPCGGGKELGGSSWAGGPYHSPSARERRRAGAARGRCWPASTWGLTALTNSSRLGPPGSVVRQHQHVGYGAPGRGQGSLADGLDVRRQQDAHPVAGDPQHQGGFVGAQPFPPHRRPEHLHARAIVQGHSLPRRQALHLHRPHCTQRREHGQVIAPPLGRCDAELLVDVHPPQPLGLEELRRAR